MQSALIEYEELNRLLSENAEDLVLLDATFVLPNTPIDPNLIFQNKRIGHAQFFDIDKIADHNCDLPHMLPSQDVFEEKVSKLGISNNSKVVIYGQTGIALGPARAWWMFRIFSHDNVFILNGSMQDWEEKGFPVEMSAPKEMSLGKFKSKYNPDRVVSMDQVSKASEHKSCLIFDARPPERFSGQAEEPRPGMRSGHIPNSDNIPAGKLINPKTGGLRDKQDLAGVIPDEALHSPSAPIMTCGSGVTACVIALAFYELGSDQWCIYDGSWSEWGQSDYPIAQS